MIFKKALILTAILAVLCWTATMLLSETAQEDQDTSLTSEQEYFFEIFQQRRSVRSFKPTQVPRDHIIKILDAARFAPTSGNQQPWKFLVIQDKEKFKQLLDECVATSLARAKQRGVTDPKKLESMQDNYNKRLSGYLSAPVIILVLTDKNSRYPAYNKWDGPLAAGYLILAARALGYGSVFITDSFPPNITHKVFAIPDNYERVCMIPLGIPTEWPQSPPKKPLNELIAFEKLSQTR